MHMNLEKIAIENNFLTASAGELRHIGMRGPI